MIAELPTTLPGVGHLSVSSMRLFLQCPERWRRRYIENEPEFVGGAAIVGSAVGAAEGKNFQQKIDTAVDLSVEDVLDAYSDEFELRAENDPVDWREDKPATLKDAGAKLLPIYHKRIAPTVQPVAVEREFRLGFDGVDWGFKGFLDFEDASGFVGDHKVKGKRISDAEAESDLQPSAYLLARREEGQPATEFQYHLMQRVKAPEPKHVGVITTTRTDGELDAFLDRMFAIATEIAWRAENDVWGYAAPGSWWCSQKWCGFYGSCPGGGLLRRAA